MKECLKDEYKVTTRLKQCNIRGNMGLSLSWRLHTLTTFAEKILIVRGLNKGHYIVLRGMKVHVSSLDSLLLITVFHQYSTNHTLSTIDYWSTIVHYSKYWGEYNVLLDVIIFLANPSQAFIHSSGLWSQI